MYSLANLLRPLMRGSFAFVLGCGLGTGVLAAQDSGKESGSAESARRDVLENEHLRVEIDGSIGAKVRSLVWKHSGKELSEEFITSEGTAGGLAEDRFVGQGYPGEAGVAVFQRTVSPSPSSTSIAYTRTPSHGPNAGLEITKTFELLSGQTVLSVKWKIKNISTARVSFVPWVHNIVNKELEKTILPTTAGISVIGPGADYFVKPIRGWIGAWDPASALFVGFLSEYSHTMRQYYSYWNSLHSLEWAYFPVALAPGESWSTEYSILVLDGIQHAPVGVSREGVVCFPPKSEAPTERASFVATKSLDLSASWKDGDKETGLQDRLPLVARQKIEMDLPPTGLDGQPTSLRFTVHSAGQTHEGLAVPLLSGASPAAVPLHPESDSQSPFHLIEPLPLTMNKLAEVGDVRIWLGEAMQRVFPTSPIAEVPKGKETLISCPQGGLAQFSLVIDSDRRSSRTAVTVGKLPGFLDSKSIQIFDVRDVETEVPSDFNIKYAIGIYPDPLVRHGVDSPSGESKRRTLFISWRVPRESPPGVHEIELLVSIGSELQRVVIPFTVEPFSIPETPSLVSSLGCWGVKPELLEAISFPSTSAAFRETCYDLFRSARLTPRETPINWNSDLPQLRDAIGAWMRPPFSSLSVPPFLKDNTPQLTVAYRALKETGALPASFVYFSDEPTQAQWPQIVSDVKAFRTVAPQLRILATIYDSEPFELFGTVDIWTRGVQEIAWKRQRLDEGDEFWGVNMSPLELEADLYLVRLGFWKFKVHGFSGFLYWNVIAGYGGDNPWKDPSCAGVNGNAHLLYPTSSGAVPSLRWQIMAEGVDDFDVLSIVEQIAQADDSKATAFLANLGKRVDAVNSGSDLLALRAEAVAIIKSSQK